MTIEITVAISLFCTILGAFVGYKNSKKQEIKEVEEKTRVMTKISMTLEEVAKDVKFIMEELTDTKNKLSDMTLEIGRLDSGHKEVVRECNRLNDCCKNLEDRVNKIEEFIRTKM